MMNRKELSIWVRFSLMAVAIITAVQAHGQEAPTAPPMVQAWPVDTAQEVAVDDSLEVQWARGPGQAVSYGIQDIVVLRGDPHRCTDQTVPKDVRITLKILATTNPDHGDYQAAQDEDSAIVRTFEIGVRPKGGQPSGLSRDLDLKAADTWSLRDAHRMLLVVHNVEVNNGAGYAEVDEIPEEVFFDLSIAWSRVYSGLGLNQSPSGLAAAYVDCNGELTANEAEAKELQFTWNTLAGMVEYQLEWTWVDDYDISGAPFNSPAELDALKYDLGRNATRISTAETNYTIPLLYDRGYIVFRVRGVGVDPNGTLLPIYTAWTSLPVQGSVGDALDDDLAVHVPGHQKKKNWQASLSYAEEGKRKEVVTYADGTSRAREVVTRINSLKVPIIAQTIYDAVGRPALQMMPAPLVEPPCGGTGVTTAPIDFVPQFNRDNEPGDITSVDIHLSGDCDVNAPVMSSASGVEHYYSPAFANSTNSLLEAPAFLPRSEGYPYSQTQYTRDNSGKVRSQGGPGPTFQLGTGHEAKYLYGKPEQMQLDRMFGSEAGYALHYQKNVQTDANGQVSVMYLDMAGRTVATSLVGTPADPVRMEAVGEGGVELTTDLFDGLPSTDPALGQAGMPGPQLQFTTTVVVPSNGDYRFDYRVVPLVLQNECWENNGTAICAHCVYDLNIRMVDQCGEEIFEVKALVGTLDLDHGSVMFSCAPQAEYQAQFEDQPYALTAGEYTLTKTLSAHAAARDFYVDAFLKPENNDCVLSFQEIYDQLALEVDPSECHLDCTDCYDALGTLENYLATNEGATEETYQMQLAACDEMCMEPSWCSVAYKNMLGDVDLYGQYGQVEVNEDQQYVATDRTSVFYTGEGSSVLGIPYFNSSSTDPGRLADQNKPLWRQPWLVEDGVGSPVYKDLDGGRPKVYLTEISPGVFAQAVDDPASIEFDTNVGLYFTYPEHLLELDDFLHEWASGFERSLVRFHPEYCYYENCKGYAVRSDPDDRRTSSDGYDNELRMAQTFEDAVGEFDFLDEVNGAPLDPVEVNILAQDPFFQMLGPDDEYAQELTDKYDVYIQLGGINYSMPEAAAIFSRCAGSPTDTWCSGFGDRHLFDGDENPLTQEQVDQINDNEWASLRGFYLSEKYKVQKKRADAYVSECDCAGVNYCIGEENTSTWYDKTHSPFVYPFEYWNFSWDFEDWWNAYIQAWNLQLSHQSCQVCNDWNYQWFSLKTPRVAEPSQMPGMDMSPMEAAYQGFMQTGQCPMATAWQLMFQEMVQNGQLPSAQDVDLGNSAGWQTVQLALTDYEDDGAPPATFDAQPVGNNVQIDLEVGGDPYCTIILTPPSGFSWENVVYVAQLNAGSGSSFTLEVYYDQDGTMVPTSIAGTMCGAYSLSPCNFPHICEPTDLAIAMEGLFNMLALADLIGSQTAEDLEGATFANGPSDIQSALGPAIMSRFSPSPPPSLQWSFAPSVPAMFLSNVDHPLEKYRLDNLSTEPADQTLGWYLDNAVLFEGLNGEEGNFFSVRLLDANAELLCTLHGQSWWQDEDGSIPVSMGDCGLPASMACDNPTYWTYEELEDVITDALVSNASDLSDVDLWESPYMSAPLAVAICPQCDAAGDPPAGGIGLTGQYNTTTDVLTFGECLTVDLNFTGNGQFDAVGPFVPPSGEDAANTIYTANLYAGANVAGTVSFMAPCMDLVPCPDCPPPTSSAAAFGNGTDSSLQAMGLVKSDTIWSVYAAYLLSVDSLNDRLGLAPGDSGHVEVLPYAYYRQHGLERSTATYRRFLRNYQAAIDPQEHLAHMDTFVVDYGNAVNVEAEYGRYQAAVEEYDARATAAGKPPAPAPVPDSLFTYRLYAGQAASYVTYLAGHTPSNQPPLGLEAYLNGDSTVDGFCESLYKEHYLPAYDGMLAESGMDSARCPEFELYTPRLSYEEFLASNLCGSDSGLALLEAYLAKFTTDSLPCPGDLPRLVPATGTMQLATVELDQGTECQRLYTLWERKQTAYTASAYRAATEIEIGIGPGGYLAFAFDGACACAQEYIGYLEPYLLWAPGDAPLPELVGLRTYCGKDARGDLYFTALQGRVAAVNGSTYHAVTGLNVALPYATWTDMRRAGDGDLLNDYTAYLGTYVAWKAGDALPDPVLGIAAYKTTPQSSCCTLFAAYEEVLDDLEGSAYMSAHGCENPKRISSCQVMVAGGQCACVEEYIAYIQAYLAWQPGSGDLPVPCPMNINMYCNASGDLACSGAYTRYLLGITALQPLVSAYNVEHGTAYTFTVPVESLFNSTGLCYCVDGYLANLWAAFNDPDNGLPNSLQTPTPPPTADPLAQAGYWSIERYCELPVPCGPNPLPPLIPEIPFSEPDPCEQAQLAGLQINAQTLYDQQIDTLTHQIEALYDSVCLSTLEQFTMNFPDKEFHYTLYYYDQAGNLVRTVPPEGVRLVPIDSPQDPEAVLIAQDRQQGSHTFFTSHGMSSNQAFNSLGQPVGSSMPDQDNMADWSTTLPNGLPNWLQVTGSWFGSGGLGYLTGQRVVGSEKRGYLYATTDGGSTWSRSNGLVASDLYDVDHPTASVGYAVGNDGTVLRTADGGSNWRLLTGDLLGSGNHLRGVSFGSASTGVVVGEGGKFSFTSNSGNSFTTSALASVSAFSGVGRTSSSYIACGVGTATAPNTPPNGVLVPITSGGVAQAPVLTGATAADITCLSAWSDLYLVAGGSGGVLMHSIDKGETWATRTTGTTESFRSLVFLDAEKGVAIMDSANTDIGVLRLSLDGGATWAAAGRPWHDLNALVNVQGSNTEMLAVGKNGQVVRVIVGPNHISTIDVEGIPSGTTLKSAWAGKDGEAIRCIVGSQGDATIRYCADLAGAASWQTVTGQMGSGTTAKAIAASVRPGNLVIGAVLSSDGTLLDGRWDFNGSMPPEILPVSSQPPIATLIQKGNDQAVLGVQSNGELRKLSLTAHPMAAPTTPWGAPPPGLPTFAAGVAAVAGNRVVLAGAAGALHRADPPQTPVWSDRSTKVQPLPLNAMEGGAGFAAGDQGTFYMGSGTNWKAVPTPVVQDLNGLVLAGPNELILVGDSGTCFSVDPADPANSYHPFNLPLDLNIRSVAVQGNSMTLGAEAGTVFYTADRNIPAPLFTTLEDNSAGAIRALGLNASNGITAVGDHALVHRLQGTTRMPVLDVFPPTLWAVHSAAGSDVYAVGDALVARHSTDGGLTWNVVPHTPKTQWPAFKAVHASAPGQAWAVGEQGLAATFQEEVWTEQTGYSSTYDLTAIARAASGAMVITAKGATNGRLYLPNGNTPPPSVASPKALYAAWCFPVFGDHQDMLVAGDDGFASLLHFSPSGAYNGYALKPIPGAPDIRALAFHDQVAGLAAGLDGALYHTDATTTPDHVAFAWDADPQPLTDGIDGQTAPGPLDVATMGFSSADKGFIGGSYAGAVQRYARVVEDVGNRFSQRFWYDALGRVVLSRNSKQSMAEPKRYSYSLYDQLGRVCEAGEVTDAGNTFASVFGSEVGGVSDPGVISPEAVASWVEGQADADRREVTRTFYDKPMAPYVSALFPEGVQDNLRLRVASTIFQQQYDPDNTVYDHATHYSYDIHGNVKFLVQDHPAMVEDPDWADQRYKKIAYDYDLLSGNVRKVSYQPGKPDAFHHRYAYDDDNRITQVETSVDGVLWDMDATYAYYPHGPLMRTELGSQKVQGVDHAYTLQGWLKGINSDLLQPKNDMGHDGKPGTVYENVGRDAYGMSLGYFGESDYKAIGTWNNDQDQRAFAPQAWNLTQDSWAPLYNGNIAHSVNSLQPFGLWGTGAGQTGNAVAGIYHYDQLNRLRWMRGRQYLDQDNDWGQTPTQTAKSYDSNYAYDLNGNILAAGRYDQAGHRYDTLTYFYQDDDDGHRMRNRLYHLRDKADQSNIWVNPSGNEQAQDIAYDNSPLLQSTPEELETQNNYTYDPMGNLLSDRREKLSNVEWTVAGKVKAVHRPQGSGLPELLFSYGAGGQRIAKTVGDPEGSGHRDHYVRDAQGNIMAVYRYHAGVMYTEERPIYGSKRVGLYSHRVYVNNSGSPSLAGGMGSETQSPTQPEVMQTAEKRYELTDHLGNVAAVVSGSLLISQNPASAYEPQLISAAGYEPGGFPLPGRNYSSGSYRHLFQGQLHDDEIYGGVGTSYAFEYRMHDSRVGRFWSIDPLAGKYAYNSPYAFSENRLIDGRELEGLEWEKVTGYAAFEWGFDLNFNDDVTYIKGFVERKANQFSAAMKAEKDAFIKEMARNPSVLLLAAPLVAIVGPELAAAAGTESLVAGAGVQTVDVASEFTQQWVQTGFDVGQVDYIDVGGAAAPWALEQAIGGAADYKPDVGFKFVGGQGDYFKDPRAAGVEMFLGGAQNRLTNSLFNPKLVGKGLFPTVTEKKFDFITGASEKVIEDEIKESAGFEKK